MSLIDEVKAICARLGPHGWKDLLLLHGLDITAVDLKAELLRELTTIRRDMDGFQDYAYEGKRGIEPGNPARSLLFHVLASPNVIKGSVGKELDDFPTLSEIETLENYVYGIQPPSMLELRNRANQVLSWTDGHRSDSTSQEVQIAIVVFASEYRPAPETVHQKHADLCFSRTGVSRVGTYEPLYDNRRRGFLPFISDEDRAFRVLPARYSPYIAVEMTGNKEIFGPMRFELPDGLNGNRKFWVPIHKLFSGVECIRDLDLSVNLNAFHVNEKIKRIHLALQRIPNYPKVGQDALDKAPYTFTEGIAELSTNPYLGNGVLIPLPHNPLVQAAIHEGKRVTLFVPPEDMRLGEDSTAVFGYFDSSISLLTGDAPEYVHVRHKIEGEAIKNLNDTDDADGVIGKIKKGNYQAQHYVDFTGDGWVVASCPQLESTPNSLPIKSAYSLVTAPDFFVNTDQGELLVWYSQELEEGLRNPRWYIVNPNNPDLGRNLLETLADGRWPPNLELNSAKAGTFSYDDSTATAIVALPLKDSRKQTQLSVPRTMRHAHLPDGASGVFAPGWDIGRDKSRNPNHLASYTLGSSFPEDSKLCAALSSFWPAVAPDAGRTFWWKEIPGMDGLKGVYPSVSPLTDEEVGSTESLGWDGFRGPRLISESAQNETWEYYLSEYVDYVESALYSKFSLQHTSKVDIEEYKNRIKAMARAYQACKIAGRKQYENPVLSFTKVESTDAEFLQASAETMSGSRLNGQIFRIVIANGREKRSIDNSNDNQKIHFEVLNKYTCFVGQENIVLVKHNNDEWILEQTL